LTKFPGSKTEKLQEDLLIKRSSLGLHLRNLADSGSIVKTQEGGWQVSENHVMQKPVKNLTPLDIAGLYIRKMIDVQK